MSLIKTLTLYLVGGPAMATFVFVMQLLFTKGDAANAFELITLTLIAAYIMSIYPPMLAASIGAASTTWLISYQLKKHQLIKMPLILILCIGLVSSAFCSAWFSTITYLLGNSSNSLDWVLREVAPTGALLGFILGYKLAATEINLKPSPN